jgi:DNA-binding transcriptional MocR family regulator
MLSLSRDGRPLTDQIVAAVVDAITTGRWSEGERLPSVRQLARQLAVSIYTVTTALERVAARGLVQARPGSGYFVTRRPPPALAPFDAIEAGLPPAETTLGFTRQALAAGRPLLPVGSGFLPPDWFAEGMVPAAMARLGRRGALAMQPAPAQGHPALRDALAERLRHQQIPAAADQLIVTFGASHAFELLVRTLLQPGDAVLVEDPGYFMLHTRLRAAGIALVPVARDVDGLVPAALEAALAPPAAHGRRPKLLFTQTLLHNPTGGSSTPARCHQLLSLAERHDLLIVEDDVYGDLADPQRPRLAQLDGLERVFHLRSFTKVLNPALRLGYLAAPRRFVAPLLEAKVLSVLSGSALEELVTTEVLESGRYPRHLAHTRDRLARARARAIAALTALGVAVDGQARDGLFLWCRLPAGHRALDLVGPAQAAGLLLAHGQLFSPQGLADDRLRLNAAYADAPALLTFLRKHLSRP